VDDGIMSLMKHEVVVVEIGDDIDAEDHVVLLFYKRSDYL
jgi:hypothetical protein